ncbi:MAG TPA: hypothetical protein VFO38_02160 [Candidatus Saccharimonadales bacterium]|nr:hypothetical protein [Candidatus Saccharimonadales bacterium]
MAKCKVFSWPGSWPNEVNDLPDLELLALTDDQLREMIHQNMRAQWHATGGRVNYLSAGDPAMWRDWIRMQALYTVRTSLGMQPLVVEGYADMLRRLRSAAHITAKDIGPLGYVRLTRIAYEVFLGFRRELGEEGAHLRLRVGMASPFDWGALVNNYVVGLDGFVQAWVNEVKEILEFVDPNDIILSYESPFGQIVTALARLVGLGHKFAHYSAGILQKVLAELPPNIHLSLHPCWGDYQSASMIEGLLLWLVDLVFGRRAPRMKAKWCARAMKLAAKIQSTKAIATFVNPLQRVAGTRLKEVLLNIAAGSAPLSQKSSAYFGLRWLVLWHGVEYIAGICRVGQSFQEVQQVRRLIEHIIGYNFDGFGPTCGLARCTEDEAHKVVRQARRLCDE